MKESLLKISYNNELSEIEEASKLFQRKYQLKRLIMSTIGCGIALILGVDMVIKNPQNIFGYVLIGLSTGLIFMQWYNPVVVRKKLLNIISSTNQESYETEIFQDMISITTIVDTDSAEEEEQSEEKTEAAEEEAEAVENSEEAVEKEGEKAETVIVDTDSAEEEQSEEKTEAAEEETEAVENSEESIENEGEESETVVSNYYFGSDLMEAMENDRMFLLFVNKHLIYIYPKRCLTDEEQLTLREIFTDKAIL